MGRDHPIFWHTTIRNLRTIDKPQEAVTVLVEYRGAILTAWFLIILVLIAARFWDYWTTLI